MHDRFREKDEVKEEISGIRKDIFKMMHYSRSSHIGSCLSIVEILYALYYRVLDTGPGRMEDPDRDVFILSKGHASAALYATLSRRGFFPASWLDRYYVDDGLLPGHLDDSIVPGVECSAGSLGHGLPIGLGIALGKRAKGYKGRVFVLVGDGECNEGSVWEAVMLAGTIRPDNLVLIVDFNHLQGMGRDVIRQDNLAERLAAFGWESLEADGHDVELLASTLGKKREGPFALVAQTVKGKGLSFTEDRLEWHYKSPSDAELSAAIRELGGRP